MVFDRKLISVLLATGVLTVGGVGQAKQAVPDEQVQMGVLRALAGAPDLAAQAISTTTNGGVVTLSGSVHDEAARNHADQLASTTPGVTRVVDQMTVSEQVAFAQAGQDRMGQSQPGNDSQGGRVLQSDGTYTTVDQAQGDGAGSPQGMPQQPGQAGSGQAGSGQQGVGQQSGGGEVPPPNGPNTDAYGRPLNGQQTPGSQGNSMPPRGNGYPNAQSDSGAGYPNSQPGYGPPPPPPGYNQPYGQPRQPYNQPYSQGYGQPYPQGNGPGSNQGYGAGQAGGQTVTVPAGTVIRVRVNQHLSSRDVNVGTPFDAMIVNDIVAGGQVAIPRGAFFQGTVVDAESSGHLKGRGELGLKLSQVTLGGKTYPIASDVFSAHGGDKTIQTVNSTVGLGALGAIFGAVAGGGVGAAIGAGAGGALGLGSSAASGRGDIFIPSEAVLTFRLTQPAEVTTVSQVEMQRLASGVPGGGEGRPQIVRRYPYPYYYGPVVYPRYYYRQYGYYPY